MLPQSLQMLWVEAAAVALEGRVQFFLLGTRLEASVTPTLRG